MGFELLLLHSISLSFITPSTSVHQSVAVGMSVENRKLWNGIIDVKKKKDKLTDGKG
jgi:hypothetical protein